MSRAVLAAAAVILLAGCGSQALDQGRAVSPPHINGATLPACPGGEPRVQETDGGPWVCDPDGPESAPPAPAVNATCTMGWVNIAGSGEPVSVETFALTPPTPDTADGYDLSDYEAMQVTVTATGGTVDVSTLTVVWYADSDQEISSGTVDVSQVITAGQTLTYTYDESVGSDPNPPQGATTCSVVSGMWTS